MFLFSYKLLKKQQFTILRFYKTNSVRVRFAPSPTGYLHLGGLRTALYNFLFARSQKGKFILRIEDTDQTRLVEGATEQLQNDLHWCGVQVDEGPTKRGKYGPYVQSQRLELYRDQVEILLENGSAYRCFCSDKRLQLLRKEAIRAQEVPKYDNRCRNLTKEEIKMKLDKGEPSCIRFKLSSDEDTFTDLIYGQITYNVYLNEGDPVIMKTDGFPTYHFANVVDDHFMEISHVFRGVEWQISTMKHILLYRAFSWTPPIFGHLPLLLNADGTKLSKRQGDIKISSYKEENIFPLALVNFIVQSGGGFSKDLEKNVRPKCHTIEELASQFDITKLKNHSGRLMPERLLEFNRLELKRRLENKVEEIQLIIQLQHMLKTKYSERIIENTLQMDAAHIKNILNWSVNRIDKLSDLFSKDFEFIWVIPKKLNVEKSKLESIGLFRSKFEKENELDRDELNKFLKEFTMENGIKFGEFMKMLRSILSGLKEGPSVAEMIEILGKKNTLQRLEICLNKTQS
ncbi:unnamed protein product [Brassicogethes aeneus]|uniref:Nondiscriminating glutamyl-tRNA synthetase EARS2, mitochondrial n=1 Tax=Brassicogethes aeneus TaxID=1431903 RepID=A0A9P0FJ10_BRAAE|nr:unnamed protein product [Brassicogethes aeneus]